MSVSLADFFVDYKNKRLKFLRSIGKSPGAYKRLFNSSYDISCRLDGEVNFYSDASKWISEYLNDLSGDEVVKLKVQLKLFKEKLNLHNSMIVIVVLIMASFSGFLGLTLLTVSENLRVASLVLTGGLALFALFKRGGLIEHMSYCSELDVLLESELSIKRG